MASRLLVVRLGSLGDLIHTVPAVNALARPHRGAEIDWLVDRVHRDLLDLVPFLASIVTLDRATPAGWWAARRRLRARRYDVAIDFQGLLKSAALARLSGAARVLGFDRRSLREPMAALLYTERVPVSQATHVIEKNLLLAAAAGAEPGPIEFPFVPVTSPVLDAIRSQVGSEFALINCGAAWPNKRWPPDRFGRIASWLRDTHGLASVAIWGPGEQQLAVGVVQSSSGAATLAPATNLADLMALSKAARLVLSGDTGPTHIAGAMGTPIVALFGPTSPARNGPWTAGDVSISRYDACECHYQRRCRRSADDWCLGTITEDDVRAAIDTRLRDARMVRSTC